MVGQIFQVTHGNYAKQSLPGAASKKSGAPFEFFFSLIRLGEAIDQFDKETGNTESSVW